MSISQVPKGFNKTWPIGYCNGFDIKLLNWKCMRNSKYNNQIKILIIQVFGSIICSNRILIKTSCDEIRFNLQLIFNIHCMLSDSWKTNIFIQICYKNRFIFRIDFPIVKINNVCKQIGCFFFNVENKCDLFAFF